MRTCIHTYTYIHFIYPRNLQSSCTANIFENISYNEKEKSKLKLKTSTNQRL